MCSWLVTWVKCIDMPVGTAVAMEWVGPLKIGSFMPYVWLSEWWWCCSVVPVKLKYKNCLVNNLRWGDVSVWDYFGLFDVETAMWIKLVFGMVYWQSACNYAWFNYTTWSTFQRCILQHVLLQNAFDLWCDLVINTWQWWCISQT